MKNKKHSELLRILAVTSRGVSAATLAGMLGISERTVRNYVKQINDEGSAVILSARDGYHLQTKSHDKKAAQPENEARLWRVLSDLLTSKEGINAFDEAESLFVSSSTVVNTIIPQLKEMVREYDLRIESRKYQFFLKGSEQSKRKLIGHIATEDAYGFFNSKSALEQLFPKQDIPGAMQSLYAVCQKSQLFLNDFALNNLLVHLLIILIRLESDNDLEGRELHVSAGEMLTEFPNREEIIALADLIADSFARDYGLRIPEQDYQQILILIALSVEHEMVDIQSVIGQEFIDCVVSILASVSRRYCTMEFSHDFALQFSLHMYYARQRCAFRISYPNPIGAQFKKDYAPVYDMAVFFAHKFAGQYRIEFNEDEIAFIAFHIGSYLENSKQNGELISCAVVVESYHALSKKLANDVRDSFADRLVVLDVIPVNRFLQRPPECDLLITTLPLEAGARRAVQVNPILTRQNIGSIREALDEIEDERELRNARRFLQKLFHKELYFRNVVLENEEAYIQFMGRHALENGYIKEAFIQDVLLRESVSSTAFTDALAVPHTISQYAERSFICVIHNDMPIQWSRKAVHFVLMVGIAEQDMKHFKGAFNLIIELFNSTSRTLELLKTNTFEEFCEQMQ